MRVRGTSGNISYPEMSLRHPDGSELCSASGYQELTKECTLDTTGTYSIWVYAVFGDESGTFNVYLARTSNPTTQSPVAMSYGDVDSGNMDAMKWYPYTFSGTSGEKVLVRAHETSGNIYLDMSLRRPDGSELCSSWGSSDFTQECTLDFTGTHTIWVYSLWGNQSGAFNIYLARTSDPTTQSPAAMSYGDVDSGNMDAMKWYPYTFSGSAGEKVLVRVRGTSGNISDPMMSLRRPDGSQPCQGYGGGNELTQECTLDVTGTHTVWVYAYYGDESGTFNLYLARTSNPTVPSSVSVSYGDVVSSGLEPMKWYPFTFSGSAGEKVLVRVRGTSGNITDPMMSLRRPDGSQLCSTGGYNEFTQECVLDVTGTHTVWVYAYHGDESGTFNIYLARTSDPTTQSPAAMSYGDVDSGNMDAMKWYPYTFSGSAGEKVLVRVRGTSGNITYPEMSLRRPGGSQLCSTIGYDDFTQECTLDVTGTHTIWVYSAHGDASGAFNIYLARTSNPTTQSPVVISYGDVDSGNMDAMKWYPFTFSGSAGEKVLVRVRGTSGNISYPMTSLRRPDGSELCQGYGGWNELTQECTLDVTGTYTAWVYAYFGDESGTFDMYLARTSVPTTERPVALTYGDVVSGAIEPLKWYPYTFSGTTGGSAQVAFNGTGGNITFPEMSLRRPDGSELCSAYGYKSFTQQCTLDGTGTYTIWIFAAYGDESGTFDLTYGVPQPTPYSPWKPYYGPSYPQARTRDPVSTTTGEFTHTHTDVSIPGRGVPLQFTRYYQSGSTSDTGLGAGWSDTYDMYLTFEPSAVNVFHPEGYANRFVHWAGAYLSPQGVYDTLVKNQDHTYTLTTKDQISYHFDTSGKLTSVADRNGNTTNVNYDGNGHLASVTDSNGRSLVFTPDANGRISQITDSSVSPARTVGFQYSNGDLVTVTDVKNGQSHFTYSNHQLLTITDSNGNTQTTNIYDSDGRVAQQADAVGDTTCIYYGYGATYTSTACPGVTPFPSANQTVVVDPRGYETTYDFDSAYRTSKVTDDAGGTVQYAYDSSNNLTCDTDQLSHRTGYSYDPTGNLTQIVDALNTDSNCQLKTGGVKRSFTYTARNDIQTATDPDGNTTVYGYDPAGNLTTLTREDNHGAPLAITNLTRDPGGNGDLKAVTDANNNVTNYSYDGHGLLQTVDVPLTGKPDQVTQYHYDDAGRLSWVTDANLNTTSYQYDTQNNLTQVTDANTPPGITNYGYDAKGNLKTTTDPRGNITRYDYYPTDSLWKVTDADNNVTSEGYDPDGNLSWLQDAKHQGTTRRTDYTYDDLDRLTKIQYPDANYNIGYGYDPAGRRTSMTEVVPANVPPYGTRTTTYNYYDDNRLLSVVASDTGTISYTNDPAGNRKSITYPDGKVVSYTPDAFNRLQSVTDWQTPANVTSYAYYPNGNLQTTTYPASTGIVSTRGYDNANRLTSLVNAEGSNTLSSYTYTPDAVGNRTQVIDTTGTTTYNYDPLYHLTGVTYPDQSATSYTYDPAGNRSTLNDGVNPAVSYTYDIANQLTQTSSNGTSTPNAYDADGNWTKSGSGSTAPLNVLYDYENRPVRLGQCIGDVNNDGSVNTTDLSVLSNHQNMHEGDPAVLDQSGNVVQYGYDYHFDLNADGLIDSADLQVVAQQSAAHLNCSDTAAYRYDGDGLRIERKQSGQTTSYIWDTAASIPIVIQDSTKSSVGTLLGANSYVYGLDMLSATDNNNVTSYFLRDGLDSTTGLTSSSGTMTDSYTYDVFGATKTHGGTPGTSTNVWKFTGELNDTTANQSPYYLRARYYDPLVGRFLSRDPLPGSLDYPQSLNRYPYVWNNPALFADPYGLICAFGHCTSEVTDKLAGLGYIDIGGTVCYGVCVTAGIQASFGEGFHGYDGFGYGPPQVGANFLVAPGQHIETGTSCGGSVSIPVGEGVSATVQVGRGVYADKEGNLHWGDASVEEGVSVGLGGSWNVMCVTVH